jgi:hypothetical protein
VVSVLVLLATAGGGLRSAAATGSPVALEDGEISRAFREVSLSAEHPSSPAARVREVEDRARVLVQRMGIERLSDLRERVMISALRAGKPLQWETIRTLSDEHGQPLGVWLTVPVWLPPEAEAVATFAAALDRWQDVTSKDRFAGHVFLPPPLAAINDKPRYRPATLTFETLRSHAPFAQLFFVAVFREGWLDVQRRVPIFAIRSGEDSYAADPSPRSGTVPCFDFKKPDGRDWNREACPYPFRSLAEIYHGHHAPQSNHRLGCALDINDINCTECKDGSPNPISRAGRQFLRDRMHALDARNLPYWVYQLAEAIGYRVPYQWHYGSGYTDWQHMDCGTLDGGQWERLQQQLACGDS